MSVPGMQAEVPVLGWRYTAFARENIYILYLSAKISWTFCHGPLPRRNIKIPLRWVKTNFVPKDLLRQARPPSRRNFTIALRSEKKNIVLHLAKISSTICEKLNHHLEETSRYLPERKIYIICAQRSAEPPARTWTTISQKLEEIFGSWKKVVCVTLLNLDNTAPRAGELCLLPADACFYRDWGVARGGNEDLAPIGTSIKILMWTMAFRMAPTDEFEVIVAWIIKRTLWFKIL